MDCIVCKDLDRTLASALAGYTAARAAAFYRVCTEVAAKNEVDMERAKTALQEHRLVCPFAIRTEAADRTLDFRDPVDTADSKAK